MWTGHRLLAGKPLEHNGFIRWNWTRGFAIQNIGWPTNDLDERRLVFGEETMKWTS
jgi:hypothetical protein